MPTTGQVDEFFIYSGKKNLQQKALSAFPSGLLQSTILASHPAKMLISEEVNEYDDDDEDAALDDYEDDADANGNGNGNVNQQEEDERDRKLKR